MEGAGVGGDGDGGLDAGRGAGGERCSTSASWLRGTSVLTMSIGQLAT